MWIQIYEQASYPNRIIPLSDLQSARTTHLSSTEKAQLDALYALNLGVSDIAKRVKRHKLTVAQYFLRRKGARQRQPRQRVARLTESDTRKIIQIVTTGRKSAKNVKHDLNLSVSEKCIGQALRECQYEQYTTTLKPQKDLYFLGHHEAAHLDWADSQLD